MMMLCTGKDVWKFVLLNGTVTGCATGLELEFPNKELGTGVPKQGVAIRSLSVNKKPSTHI